MNYLLTFSQMFKSTNYDPQLRIHVKGLKIEEKEARSKFINQVITTKLEQRKCPSIDKLSISDCCDILDHIVKKYSDLATDGEMKTVKSWGLYRKDVLKKINSLLTYLQESVNDQDEKPEYFAVESKPGKHTMLTNYSSQISNILNTDELNVLKQISPASSLKDILLAHTSLEKLAQSQHKLTRDELCGLIIKVFNCCLGRKQQIDAFYAVVNGLLHEYKELLSNNALIELRTKWLTDLKSLDPNQVPCMDLVLELVELEFTSNKNVSNGQLIDLLLDYLLYCIEQGNHYYWKSAVSLLMEFRDKLAHDHFEQYGQVLAKMLIRIKESSIFKKLLDECQAPVFSTPLNWTEIT